MAESLGAPSPSTSPTTCRFTAVDRLRQEVGALDVLVSNAEISEPQPAARGG